MASNNLQLQIVLSAIDNASAPFKSIIQSSQKLAEKINVAQKSLDNLNRVKSLADKFANLRQETNQYSRALDVAKINSNQLQLVVDNSTNKFNSIQGKIGNATQQLNKHREELTRLQAIYQNMTPTLANGMGYKGFQNARESIFKQIKEKKDAIRESNQRIKVLKSERKQEEITIKNVTKSLENEKTTIKKLNDSYQSHISKLKSTQEQLKKSDFNTINFANSQKILNENIEITTSSLKNQKRWLEKVNKISEVKNKISGAISGSQGWVTSSIGANMAGRAILNPIMQAGHGVVGMAKTAGQFEQFQSILEVTEGSAEKAKASLEWVKQFAVDTPNNLDETMEAFVRLRAYGMDPTNGLLKTLGDTGAAMGKPVLQAVEAVADAITGENERLKEFGVVGRAIKGSNIIEYEYTDKNGKQQIAKVNKTNRKQIEQTLTRIFKEKYDGTSEKQAKTIIGIWSKLEDYWTNLQVDIMQSGAFDWIKNKLQGVLDILDKMQQNGELKKWANDIGNVIKEVAQGFWEFGMLVFNGVKIVAQFARENKGVIATIIKCAAVFGVLLITLAPLLFSLSLLIPLIKMVGIAFSLLGKVFLTNPLGLVISAIAMGAYLIYQNWEPLSQWFKDIWDKVKLIFDDVKKWFSNLPNEFLQFGINMINSLSDGIKNTFKKVTDFIDEKINWIKSKLGFSEEAKVKINEVKEKTEKVTAKAMTESNQGGIDFVSGLGYDPTKSTNSSVPNVNKWSGGYAGNGGKYEPMGIFHGGEYIMTKEATSRLGVPLLNALNYGKNTMLAAGLGVSVAAAQPVNLDVVKDIQHQIMVMPPIQVDDRAPLRQTQTQQVQITQPMNITIQVNATQGMDERALAREVARQIAQIQNQAQARARSDLRDRG